MRYRILRTSTEEAFVEAENEAAALETAYELEREAFTEIEYDWSASEAPND